MPCVCVPGLVPHSALVLHQCVTSLPSMPWCLQWPTHTTCGLPAVPVDASQGLRWRSTCWIFALWWFPKSFNWHVLTIIQFTQIPVPSPSKMPPLSLSSLEHFIPVTSCMPDVLENAGVIHGRYLNELPLLPPFMPSLPVVFFFAVAPVVESAVCLGQLYGILTNWNLLKSNHQIRPWASACWTLQTRSTTCYQQNHNDITNFHIFPRLSNCQASLSSPPTVPSGSRLFNQFLGCLLV